ncbi:MAG: S49 family peptidase, partial [Rhodospirillaceae bacterium]
MRAYEAALTAPWAMTEEWIETVLSIAHRDHAAPARYALEAYRARHVQGSDRLQLRDRVGILNVRGPMFRYANMFTEISGATSYQQLSLDLQQAVDRRAVDAIVLNIDSPGGEVTGVAELAAAIRQAANRKPVVAYVAGTGASAAYWLAAAADEIVIDSTAVLGSIGVRIAIRDDRDQRQRTGERRHEFVSSVSPHKDGLDALDTDEGRQRVQATADALGQVFVEAVAQYRDVAVETVVADFGRGGVLVGQAAVTAGLADRLGSFEAVIAELSAGKAARSSSHAQTEVQTMSKESSAPAAAGDPGIDLEAARKEAFDRGYEAARQASVETLSEGGKIERERLAAIVADERVKGRELVAINLALRSDMTPDAVAEFVATS